MQGRIREEYVTSLILRDGSIGIYGYTVEPRYFGRPLREDAHILITAPFEVSGRGFSLGFSDFEPTRGFQFELTRANYLYINNAFRIYSVGQLVDITAEDIGRWITEVNRFLKKEQGPMIPRRKR